METLLDIQKEANKLVNDPNFKQANTIKYINFKHSFINIKHGEWLFTCNMIPLQFDHFNYKEAKYYFSNINDYKQLSQLEKEAFHYDNFVTINGSHHSIRSCGFHPISEKYAKFFIKHKLHELYTYIKDPQESFDIYENKVKEFCKYYKIEYEGI